MGPLRLVARPMLASIFVKGGLAQLTDPEGHVPVARDVTDPVLDAAEDAVPQAADAEAKQLVQLNGAAQVLGGVLLALGKLPRVAALLLAGSLVPTTWAAHRFWEESDPQEKQAQQIHFLKNVSLLGGLLIATMDREGKPSLAWRGGHAVDHARIAADHAAEITRLKGELARERATHATDVTREKAKRKGQVAAERAKRAAAVDPIEHAKVRKDLARKQLTPDVMDAKRLIGALRSDDD